MNYSSLEALQPVINVINEAKEAIGDETRTIRDSAIPEVLIGALGAACGGCISFGALYGSGVVGLSAAGITSGLASVGSIIGRGMTVGIFVLAVPIAGLGALGVKVASYWNKLLKS